MRLSGKQMIRWLSKLQARGPTSSLKMNYWNSGRYLLCFTFKCSKLLVLLTVKGRVHFYKGFTSFSKHLDISEFGYIWNILHEDLQMFLIKKSAKGK